MKITKRQLRRLIRESILREQPAQMSLPMHGAEPLAGSGDDNYYAAIRTPEAVKALRGAGFNSNGEIQDPSMGLGVFDHGMYTPQTQEELGDTIQAAIEINHSLNAALESLKNDDYPNAYEAWIDTVYPAQRKWSDRGASDTEGRERAADWLESHGFDWE